MVTSILPLTLTGACARVHGTRILGPVDLTLNPGGVTIVIGPNGAGKTTLLRLIHGLQRLSDGSQRWNAPLDRVRARQAFIFQQPTLMRRSVVDNIAYPLRLRGMPRPAARARAQELAARCGLAQVLSQSARSLSAGERQKLALARALIRDPEMLILDEPTAHLDGHAIREVEAILQSAVASGKRLVMATHDMGQARRLATEMVLLNHGRIVETGPAGRFFDQPRTAQARAFLNGDILT